MTIDPSFRTMRENPHAGGAPSKAGQEVNVVVGERGTKTLFKLHGLGNDYLFLDGLGDADPALPGPDTIRAVCDRHRGFGSDGLIALVPTNVPGADFRMRIWNADGSEGEMCGNGLRCAVKLFYEHGHRDRSQASCRVETGAGILEVWPIWQGSRVAACREELGRPTLLPLGEVGEPWIEKSVTWQRGESGLVMNHTATAVSMGNPHLVLFAEERDPIRPDVDQDGPSLERHPLFPERVNVGFAEVLSSDAVYLAVWERGSGATQACGTGAAACLAAGVITGRLKRRARVELPGGILDAEWPADAGSVYLTGPAEFVDTCLYEENRLPS